MTGERPDDAVDATRRTRLANERLVADRPHSVCDQFRSGADCSGALRRAEWPCEVIGVSFGVVGVAFVGYGYFREQAVDAALARGEYAQLPNRAALIFAALGVLLGLATIVLLLALPNS